MKRTFHVLFGLLVAGWLWTSACRPLWADVTATILGNVTGPTGAAVPAARVTVRNQLTGLGPEVITDTTGGYEFLAFPVGAGYSVDVEAQGFGKAAESGITLLVKYPGAGR
jgi:hypothetical protein